jgi:ornithine cyclodeaminase
MNGLEQYSEAEVAAALADLDVLAVVRGAFLEHHRGRTTLPAEAYLPWRAPDGGCARSIAMHAHLPGPPPRAGLKLINGALGNPDRGLPRASGIIALFDPETARITDLLPAAEISAIRTAAVSTLAALQLAAPSPRRLALLGAGVLAAIHARLMAAALPIEELVVFDRDRARAERLVTSSRVSQGWVAAGAEEAIRGADLIVTATTTTDPYIHLDWLAPGSVVLNVSLDDLRAEAFLAADALYVDDWSMVTADRQRLLGKLARAGDVVAPGERPRPGGRAVTAELGELFAGAAEVRRGSEQRMIVNPFGLAIADIALAAAVAEQRERLPARRGLIGR